MLGKLIKLEFKSSFRMLLVVWAALLAVTIIMCLLNELTGAMPLIAGSIMPGTVQTTIMVISWILYGGIFAAVVALTIAVIIVRFYKGLLGDEGYLMHTLPVKEWQLITAKGVVAACAVIGSGIVIVISLFVISTVVDINGLIEIIGQSMRELSEEPVIILFIIEGLIIGVFGVLKSVYQIYAAIAIGQLANRHRILISLGAYIGISIVLGLLVGIVSSIPGLFSQGGFLFTWLSSIALITADGISGEAQLALLIIFLATAAQLVAFHIVTERLLSKRLNLL